MIIITLLVSFLLNILNHGNLMVSVLNILLLLFSVLLYLKVTKQSMISFKLNGFQSIFFILIGVIPLFVRENNILVMLFAIGLAILLLLFVSTQHRIMMITLISLYILIACFYGSEIIKFPFIFQNNLIIFNDNWTNSYITQMRAESNYMPHIMRLFLYNFVVHFYVLASKVFGIFTLENFYDALLLANIYPLIMGLNIVLRSLDTTRKMFLLWSLLIVVAIAFSRSIVVDNTFVLLSPLLIYFVLEGLNKVNKFYYTTLIFISIFISTCP